MKGTSTLPNIITAPGSLAALIELLKLIDIAMTTSPHKGYNGIGMEELNHIILSCGFAKNRVTKYVTEYSEDYCKSFGNPKSRSRNFHLVEALLSSQSIRKVLFHKQNGGLVEGYVFFANLDRPDDKKYIQAHHRSRRKYLWFPPAELNIYAKILYQIKKRKKEENEQDASSIDKVFADLMGGQSVLIKEANKSNKYRQAEQLLILNNLCNPTNEEIDYKNNINISSVGAREIIDEFILELRKKQNTAYRSKKLFSRRPGITEIAFIRPIMNDLQWRSPFEKANQVLLVPDGEMFFAIFLHRLFSHADISSYSNEIMKSAGVLLDDSKVSNAALRAIAWLKEELNRQISPRGKSKNEYQGILVRNLPRKRGFWPCGFGLNKSSLAILKSIILPVGAKLSASDLIRVFNCFILDSNSTYTIEEKRCKLADIMDFDPFVVDIALAQHEKDVNINKSHPIRYLLCSPIDPISDKKQNTKPDIPDMQRIFALWVSYIERDIKNPIDRYRTKQRLDPQLNRLAMLLNGIGQPIARELIEEDLDKQVEYAREQAIRSSTAAIMSRNMSHLLGSHIEPGIQSDIRSLILISTKSRLVKHKNAIKIRQRLVNWERDKSESDFLIETKDKTLLPIEASNELKLLFEAKDLALERYSGYRQRRMDFIARLATDWPEWGLGGDFFSYFVSPFMANSILLHFAGYSDFLRIDGITFYVGIIAKNGNGKAQHIRLQTNIAGNRNIILQPVEIFTHFNIKDLKVSTINPSSEMLWARGGDMGVQAFHIILENLLRNSIKHSNVFRVMNKNAKKLRIGIFLYEEYKHLTKQFKPIRKMHAKEDINGNNLHIIVTSSVDNDMDVAKRLDKKLCASMLTNEGKSDPDSWGMKEIKIAAAFMANSDRGVMDCDSIKPDYIHAGVYKWPDNKSTLAYCIRVPKYYYMGVMSECQKS